MTRSIIEQCGLQLIDKPTLFMRDLAWAGSRSTMQDLLASVPRSATSGI